MIRHRASFSAAILFLFAQIPTSAGPVANGNYTHHQNVRLRVSGSAPPHVMQGISSGASSWNRPQCNTGFDDFPIFHTSGSINPTLRVEYIQGPSTDQIPFSTCAAVSNSPNGTNSELLLFSQIHSGGQTYDCFPPPGTLANATDPSPTPSPMKLATTWDWLTPTARFPMARRSCRNVSTLPVESTTLHAPFSKSSASESTRSTKHRSSFRTSALRVIPTATPSGLRTADRSRPGCRRVRFHRSR